jgi:outer membrane receptor protein involved in Fe transport
MPPRFITRTLRTRAPGHPGATATATAVAALLGGLAAPALAQAPAPAADTGQLQTVTITGEKMARDLRNTTNSVGVIDGQRLEDAGIRSVADSLRLLGNVRDADWVDAGIVFRGINSEGVGGPSGRPLATTYVDGVAQTLQGARRGPLGSWDVQQIEVYRGPQSTSFGRNSLAGAISVKSNDPVGFFEYAGRVQLGTESLRGAAVMLNAPIAANTLALRIAGEVQQADGDVRYGFPGYTAADLPHLALRSEERYRQLRGKLLWTPSGARGPQVLLTHQRGYDSPSYDDVDGPTTDTPDRDFFARTWGGQTSPIFDQARGNHNQHTALEVVWPLSPQWKLTSLTTRVATDLDVFSIDGGRKEKQPQSETAQELRLNFDAGATRAVMGLYFNSEKAEQIIDEVRSFQPTRQRDGYSRTKVRNSALFGEVNMGLGPWTLLAGARYDREKLDQSDFFRVTETTTGAFLVDSQNAFTANYSAFLPKLGVTYALSPTSTVGAVVQRGYRAGGGGINGVTFEPYTYEPEKLTNFELSYRLENAAKTLRFNANLFHMQWRNMQIEVAQVFGGQGEQVFVTQSGGESRINGFELELQSRATRDLFLFASAGYADSQFEKFIADQFGTLVDYSGLPFPQAPKLTASAGFTWRMGALQLGGDLKHSGRAISRSAFEGLPADFMPAYTVLNAQAAFDIGKNVRVSLSVTNLTDEKFFLYRYDDPGFRLATVGEPRKAMVQIDAKF